MTNDLEKLAFERRLEQQDFIFDEELLKKFLDSKLKRLHHQSTEFAKLKSNNKHK